MKLQPRTETFVPAENHSWLGSKHGTDTPDTIQLDAAACLAVYPDGLVKSGTVLGKITATGRYAPYASGASDGSQTAAGILYTSVDVSGGVDSPAAMLRHCFVLTARLPRQSGAGSIDAGGRTALRNVIFD